MLRIKFRRPNRVGSPRRPRQMHPEVMRFEPKLLMSGATLGAVAPTSNMVAAEVSDVLGRKH